MEAQQLKSAVPKPVKLPSNTGGERVKTLWKQILPNNKPQKISAKNAFQTLPIFIYDVLNKYLEFYRKKRNACNASNGNIR